MTAAVTALGEAAGMTDLESCELPVGLPSAVPPLGKASIIMLMSSVQSSGTSSLLRSVTLLLFLAGDMAAERACPELWSKARNGRLQKEVPHKSIQEALLQTYDSEVCSHPSLSLFISG